MASLASSGKFVSSKVFVRIRPEVRDGSGHDQDGEKVAKSISKWDEQSVTLNTEYMFSKDREIYDFPKKVFGPDKEQQEVFDASISDYVDSFIQKNGTDVIYFAYGQTGTGKTHTIFGTDESLSSTEFHQDWGFFPRICHKIFESFKQNSSDTIYTLHASAVEFYMYQIFDAYDLTKPNKELDENGFPAGIKSTRLQTSSDVSEFIHVVISNRVTRGTAMNKNKGEHSGSSRSHCALILTLMQLNKNSNQLIERHFTLVDLAGAERPEKTGEPRKSPLEVMMEMQNGKISIGSQGLIINFELSVIRSEAVRAYDLMKMNKNYNATSSMVPPICIFIGSFYSGYAKMGMIICLSQAPQCGWETWFSMQYGKDLARIKALAKTRKSKDFKKLYQETLEDLKNVNELVKTVPPRGSAAEKYLPKRLAKKLTLEDLLDKLDILNEL